MRGFVRADRGPLSWSWLNQFVTVLYLTEHDFAFLRA